MLAVAMDDEQIELFPRATAADIQLAKKKLSGYADLQSRISDLQNRIHELNAEQLARYRKGCREIQLLERAVALIRDEEVRRIIEYRYIQGNRSKWTKLRFSGSMHDRTVERKIDKGIESVAESLLFMK